MYKRQYKDLANGTKLADKLESIAGRIANRRAGGKGLVFIDLMSEGEKVQVVADLKNFPDFQGDGGIDKFMALMNTCKRGDVIGVRGTDAPMVIYTYERHYEAHRSYFERFATGVECYLNGDWVWAREYLVWCYAQNPADRPAVVLLEYMAAKRFAAPNGWLGCRRDDYEDDADALRV